MGTCGERRNSEATLLVSARGDLLCWAGDHLKLLVTFGPYEYSSLPPHHLPLPRTSFLGSVLNGAGVDCYPDALPEDGISPVFLSNGILLKTSGMISAVSS